MKTLKFLLITALFIAWLTGFAYVSYAASAIAIDDVTFEEYTDEYGVADTTLLTVKVGFTMPAASKHISILLTAEGVSELSVGTKAKVIYMNQDLKPNNGIYEFTIEKSKIADALGLAEVSGCALTLSIGGGSTAETATKTVVYYDPASPVMYGDVTGDGEIDIGDAVQVLRYEAGLTTFDERQKSAADVTGDGEIDIGDAVRILRFEAGLITALR